MFQYVCSSARAGKVAPIINDHGRNDSQAVISVVHAADCNTLGTVRGKAP